MQWNTGKNRLRKFTKSQALVQFSIPQDLMAETYRFHRECYQSFVKVNILSKWKSFVKTESTADVDYATRPEKEKTH